jgi:hypothetical protein
MSHAKRNKYLESNISYRVQEVIAAHLSKISLHYSKTGRLLNKTATFKEEEISCLLFFQPPVDKFSHPANGVFVTKYRIFTFGVPSLPIFFLNQGYKYGIFLLFNSHMLTSFTLWLRKRIASIDFK